MTPIRTDQTNAVLGVSEDQKAQGVKPLPYVAAEGEVTSQWLLTEADLDALVKNGGIVSVTVWGRTHPPLSLHVEPDLKACVILPDGDKPARIAKE